MHGWDRRPIIWATVWLCFSLAARAGVAAEPHADAVEYEQRIKPLFKARCLACHGALKQKAKLRLDTGQAIRAGGDSGPAIEPGQPDESLLIERVTESDNALRMPPEGAPLSAEQVALLKNWIARGGKSPADEKPEADPKSHWSFQPPRRPELPETRNPSWIRDPLDRFVAAEHDRRGLTPAPQAEPQVLLRRLYLDLTGLPPSRADLEAFLADPSDQAYERVVDRLLASPRHGERWARHWMDVWRYSDWYGRRSVPDVLNSYAQIWRWRDWIVRSLNDDKGYDEMLRDMLAADELKPGNDADAVATGFLVRNFYRWNYNTWMKDNVEHTGKAFLGLTFNCAHCHDHKYDPIKHEDYFAFRAIFEPLEIRHDRVPGEPDPGPYPKYDYGKAYKPITSGLVRVIDEKLDAQTYLYTRGESRNVVPDRPPIEPGMPGFLGGKSFRVEPIELPRSAWFPGSRDFVRQDERAPRESALARAELALARAMPAAQSADRVLRDLESRVAGGSPRAFADPHWEVPAFAADRREDPSLRAARAALGSERERVELAELECDAARRDGLSLSARMAADDARDGLDPKEFETLKIKAAHLERSSNLAQARWAVARGELAVKEARGKPTAELRQAAQERASALKALAAAQEALKTPATAYTSLSPTYPRRSTGRRAALARWISDRANPLTARVAVNHLWRWHFGQPLVATTSDFGRNGTPPTHPELLDWLAVELMEPTAEGTAPWSFKALHRRIVLSATYRMSSNPFDRPEVQTNRSIDQANRWLWRFPTSRMEAEEVRDGLLQVAGLLDSTMGGPDIDFTQGLTTYRRSLYYTHHGEARMAFLELFDAPDACDAYKRSTSVVPQQALALVNNDLLLTLSGTLADRLWTESTTSPGQPHVGRFVDLAFEQILTRRPSAPERELAQRFLEKQEALLRQANWKPKEGAGALEVEVSSRARRDLVQALFNHHDFVTIH